MPRWSPPADQTSCRYSATMIHPHPPHPHPQVLPDTSTYEDALLHRHKHTSPKRSLSGHWHTTCIKSNTPFMPHHQQSCPAYSMHSCLNGMTLSLSMMPHYLGTTVSLLFMQLLPYTDPILASLGSLSPLSLCCNHHIIHYT